MTCAELALLWDRWLDRELPAEESAEADLHLQACTACQREAQTRRHQHEQLRAAFEERRAAADAMAFRAMHGSPRRGPRTQFDWRTAGIAAMAAAAGFLLALVVRPHQTLQVAVATRPTQPLAARPASPPPLELAVSTGAVEVCKNGVWSAMPTGGQVDYGCAVRTPPNTRCEFRTPEGSEIRLHGGTEIVVPAPRRVVLNKGRLWSTVAPAAEPFQVRSDDATVTALGTQFDVDLIAGTLTLMVLAGRTELQLGQEKVAVAAGQMATAKGDRLSPPDSVPQYELLRATNWVNELLFLKGHGNPELVARIGDLFAHIGETKSDFLLEEEIRLLGDHCVLPLTRYLLSERSAGQEHKRRQAARILADLAQPWSIKDLITLLDDPDGEVRVAAARALRRLTNQDFGVPVQAWSKNEPVSCNQARGQWQAWWKKNQFGCAPAPPAPQPTKK